MKICSLCKNRYDKLFKPEEKLLDTELSDVIKFVFCDHSLEFPPNFLICTECSLALIQTKIVLTRLSEALPNSRHLINEQKLNNGQELNQENDEDENTETNVADSANNAKSLLDWTFNCKNCEYTTTKSALYKSHLRSKHKSDDPCIYHCTYCTESYPRKNGIKTHIEREHENIPRPIRQRRKTIAFDSPNVLSSTTIKNEIGHGTSAADANNDGSQVYDPNMPYEFVCTHCNYKTTQPKFFKRHMSTKHEVEDSRIYKCKLCPSTYIRQFALNNHIAYEHEKKPKPQRRKSINADVSLKNTDNGELLLKNKSEEEEEDLRCEHCLYQANNASSLEKHIVIVHQDDSINTNGYDFEITNHEEQQHQQSDEDKKQIFQVPQKRSRNHLSDSENPSVKWVFHCSHCDFESRKKKTFKTHLSDVHDIDDNNLFKCTYCRAAYERYSLLQQHVTIKHNIDLTSLSDTAGESDVSYIQTPKKQKREVTPLASKKSKSEGKQTPVKSLKSNEVKAKESCVVCGKVFASAEKLRSHMDKRHGGDEIKKCQNCDTQFHSLEKYEAHLFSEKCLDVKLECQYPGCPKRFNKPSKMRQHMQEKHPDLEI